MSSQRQQVIDFLNSGKSGVQVYPAEVISVEGDTCTVKLLASDLEVDEVKLHADPGLRNKVVFYPKKGSTVLVGCVENEVANLYVAQLSEVTGFDVIIGESALGGDKNAMVMQAGKASVFMDTNKLTVAQGQTNIELAGGKVKITNGTVSLKTLFSDLTTMLKTFTVITSTGASTGVFPTTLTSIATLEAKVNGLLS